MSNFKRLLVLVLAMCLCLCVAACGQNASGSGDGTSGSSTQGSSTTESTSSSTETTSDGKVDYVVTVVYPDGTPVVGAYVQICLDDLCYTPDVTDDNGVVVFRLAQQDGYKTKLAMAVEGYVLEDYIYFESGATEITITLVAEG